MKQVTLNASVFEVEFKHGGRVYDAFRIKHSSRSALYITAYIKGIPMTTLQKRVQIEDDNAYLSFGKEKIVVGTCKEC